MDAQQGLSWIRRNAFFGEFRLKNRGLLASTGTFVLKVAADSQQMEGRCGWSDSDNGGVWSAHYEWSRRAGP